MKRIALLLLLLPSLLLSTRAKHHWATKASLGAQVSLDCFDRELYPFSAVPNASVIQQVAWILPACDKGDFNRTVRYPWSFGDRYLAQSGFQLVVRKVHPKYHGIYFCAVFAKTSSSQEWFYIRRGLNPHVMIQQHGAPLGRALGLATAFFASCLIIGLTNLFRFETRAVVTSVIVLKPQTSPFSASGSLKTYAMETSV